MKNCIKPLRPLPFLALLLLFSTGRLWAQTYVYDAFIKGHKAGQMTVVREVNDERIKISVSTHIEAHMLVSIKVDFESHSSYMDGKLMDAEAISKTNGHIHSQTQTSYRNGQYEIHVDKKKPKILNERALYGGDLFYFEAPAQIKKVYALATGDFMDIQKEGPDSYYFVHGGKKELHTYSEGILTELQIEHRLYTVVFKLVQ